jgi:hypothetical protein
MKTQILNLDVDSPDKVSAVLRAAANEYYQSASELESAWQDKRAGAPWAKIARILEHAADQIDKSVNPASKIRSFRPSISVRD